MEEINVINKLTSKWFEPIKKNEQPVLSYKEKNYPVVKWEQSTGKIGNLVSYDIETELINRENPKHEPRIVLAVAFNGKHLYRIEACDLEAFISAHKEDTKFICHNAAFDIIHTGFHIKDPDFKYKLAEEERVFDTYILSRLINLAKNGECKPIKGKYSLAGLVSKKLNLELPKEVEVNDKTVRLSYGQFLDTDLSKMPSAYWYYCCWDTLSVFYLWKSLAEEAINLAKVNGVSSELFLSHFVQVKAQTAFTMLNREGIGLDGAKVSENKERLETKIKQLDKELEESYNYKGGTGKRERFSAAAKAAEKEFNVDLPKILHKTTGKETYSQSKVELERFTHIPFFKKYIEREHVNKLLKTFVTSLIGQKETFPRYNILMSSGRSSCTGSSKSINLQQTPRPNKDYDLRSMFRAKKGSTYVLTDLGQAELVCISQVLHDLGFTSNMRKLINNNEDIHLATAKAIDSSKDPASLRTLAKAASFGFLGGMGISSFKTYSESFGLKLTELQVKAIKKRWLSAYPEFVKFFNLHGEALRKILIVENEIPPNIPSKYAPTSFFDICEGTSYTRTGYKYQAKEVSWVFDRLTVLLDKYPKIKRFEEDIYRKEGSIELLRAVRGLALGVVRRSGRLRANTSFCDYNNNFFQGSLSDLMLSGLFDLFRESEATGLFRIRGFIHDETICETKEEDKEKAKEIIEKTLLNQAKRFCPDVLMKADSTFSPCWTK